LPWIALYYAVTIVAMPLMQYYGHRSATNLHVPELTAPAVAPPRASVQWNMCADCLSIRLSDRFGHRLGTGLISSPDAIYTLRERRSPSCEERLSCEERK
jgi:hypothetical protein